MLWFQSAQNIGQSNHKLKVKVALKCTVHVWSQCTPAAHPKQTYRTDGQTSWQ